MKQSKFCKLIFSCLCRGICALEKDYEISNDLSHLPVGLKINLGILPVGKYIGIIKTEDGLRINYSGFDSADLNVSFKTHKAAKRVMLARCNCAQSYARHELIVGGDIATALTFVRIINKVECYLFPRFMTKKILPKASKNLSTLKTYFNVLFHSYKLQTKGEKNE